MIPACQCESLAVICHSCTCSRSKSCPQPCVQGFRPVPVVGLRRVCRTLLADPLSMWSGSHCCRPLQRRKLPGIFMARSLGGVPQTISAMIDSVPTRRRTPQSSVLILAQVQIQIQVGPNLDHTRSVAFLQASVRRTITKLDLLRVQFVIFNIDFVVLARRNIIISLPKLLYLAFKCMSWRSLVSTNAVLYSFKQGLEWITRSIHTQMLPKHYMYSFRCTLIQVYQPHTRRDSETIATGVD